jgi:stage II sporulation protein D
MRRSWLLALLLLVGCGNEAARPLLAATAPPKVRIRLQRRAPRYVLSFRDQAWEILSAGGPPFIRRARTDMEVTLQAGPRGVALGPEDTGASVLRIRGEKWFTVNGTRYPGDLVVYLDGGGVRLVNETDLEGYVAGVIGNEMAPGAPPAAYRAQAVAARTYAWIRLQDTSRARDFDLYDDQASQVYTGLDPRYDADPREMREHALKTAGVILTWRSQPFPAYYSSTCGGHTTDPRTSQLDPGGAAVVLRGVRCDFCRKSSRFAWTRTVTDEDLVAGMKRRRRPISLPIHAIEVTRKGAGGWAAEVTITYGPDRRKKTLPGTEFRSACHLDSHHIKAIRRTKGAWEIQGRGWGHGVGLCQMGAVGMAEQGFSESEILSWYYPGSVLTRVY